MRPAPRSIGRVLTSCVCFAGLSGWDAGANGTEWVPNLPSVPDRYGLTAKDNKPQRRRASRGPRRRARSQLDGDAAARRRERVLMNTSTEEGWAAATRSLSAEPLPQHLEGAAAIQGDKGAAAILPFLLFESRVVSYHPQACMRAVLSIVCANNVRIVVLTEWARSPQASSQPQGSCRSRSGAGRGPRTRGRRRPTTSPC